MLNVVQHVHDVRSPWAGRIVNSGVGMTRMLAELRGALSAEIPQVVFGAGCRQPVGQALMHAGYQPRGPHDGSIRCNCGTFFVSELNFGILNGQSVTKYRLHDRAIGGTRAEAGRFGAMHASVFAHQPASVTGLICMLVEANEIVVIPCRKSNECRSNSGISVFPGASSCLLRYLEIPSAVSSDGAPCSSQSLNSPNAWARHRHMQNQAHKSPTSVTTSSARGASS
jgi:hypothetical protein